MTVTEVEKINSRASLDRSPGKNWVERSGGLPMYIRRIANHLHQEKGMTISHAIAVAVNAVHKMCATGDLNWRGRQNVNPKSRAEACAALADWERKKAQARVTKGIKGRKMTNDEFIYHLTGETPSISEIHKGCGCEHDDKPEMMKKKKKVKKRFVSDDERKKLAGKRKALPDGSFPIANRNDLKNAIRAVGRASNTDEAKRHIIRCAKEMGMTDMLPDNWEISKGRKGFNPSQPRDPRTGRWIDLPGTSSLSKIGIWELEDGSHGVFGKKSGNKRASSKPIKTFKTKKGAQNFARKEIESDRSGLVQRGLAEGRDSSRRRKKDNSAGQGKSAGAGGTAIGRKPRKNAANPDPGGTDFPGRIVKPRGRATAGAGSKGRSKKDNSRVPLLPPVLNKSEGEDYDFLTDKQKNKYNRSRRDGKGHDESMNDALGEMYGSHPSYVKRRNRRIKKSFEELTDEEFEVAKSFLGDNPDAFEFDVQGNIEKRNDEKQLVFGWASVAKKADGTVVVDKQGDVLEDIDQMEKVAYDFVLHSRDGGEMHIRKGVSTLVESFVATPEKCAAMGIPEGTLPTGWWVGFKVNDKGVWDKVKKGHYKMFSVHGSGLRKALED